jgi:GT2 family glycosyltransferase
MTERVAGRVSVVVPCYNGARHLREAIDGVLAQTHPDVELVVADDGSTDESVAIASSYGARVRVVAQPNAGPATARNLALRHASGEFVALLDADDRFHPTKLASQVARLRTHEDAGAVYCGWRLVDGEGRPFPEEGWPSVEGDLLRRLVLGNLFHPVSVVVRRHLVDAVGGFDARCPVNEDWDLFLRLSLAGARWACVNEALCDYRIHAGQSHERLALVYRHALAILDRTFGAPGAAPIGDLRDAAYAQAHLRAAAEHYAAGDDEAGGQAFRAAVAVDPSVALDARLLLRFLRRVLPDGHRSQAELVRRRRDLMAVAGRAIAAAEREGIPAWRARLALRQAALRLAWRALRGHRG